MLDNLYPDVVVLAGGGQTPSRPVPPIFPAPPPDYRALLRHPDDFEFSVNGCYVRIWNAAGCLGSVDIQLLKRLSRHKTASAALKTLAYGRHRLAFSPCICHFLPQNPLQKLNVNRP